MMDRGSPALPSPLRIAIGIATRGRPKILRDTIADIALQTRQPDAIVVAATAAEDVEDAAVRFPSARFLQSEPGLTCQRNAVLAALEPTEADIVLFLDDDFYMHPMYLAHMEQVFAQLVDVVAATGQVLADGINGPGLTLADAKEAIRMASSSAEQLTSVFNAYGCNMALRLQPIRAAGLAFDEKLPLYGWYEDVDFCRRLAPFGRIVRIEQACGVHLGAKSGRQSGLRLGYSQVANPVYLARKRSVPWRFALASMLSRSLKNLVYSARPEPWVDRRGRFKGNLKAWLELANGTLEPGRILDL